MMVIIGFFFFNFNCFDGLILLIINCNTVAHFFNGNTYGNSGGVSEQEEISRANCRNAYPCSGLKKDASSKAMTDGLETKEEKGA